MLDIVTIVSGHLIVGGLAANGLVIMGLLNVAFGGEGSQVSPARRLPKDSDAKLFGLVFAVGAVCGLMFALISGFEAEWPWVIPTGLLGFTAGSIVAFKRASTLNDHYLVRAQENLGQGKYKEALEDANEVARSSERLRSQAKQIAAAARELRLSQPIVHQAPPAETASGLATAELLKT